ncbi:MBL fold metallo-hydrolase [Candidatus Fermentibacteria bacterium]|nr:MBL fold metallo-hydrolase [Candidatus Fermentibacteria bacterium]
MVLQPLIVAVFASLLDQAPLDINTAGSWQLEQLPGIGAITAERIVTFRERFGPFLELGDVAAVDGVSEDLLENLSGLATVVPDSSMLSDTSHWLAVDSMGPSLLDLVFLDVGNGDAILIRATNGETWLVDGGPDEGGPVAPPIVAAILTADVDTLDMVVLTHPHADHVGGLDDVMQRFPVRRVLDPALDFASPLYERFLEAVLDSKADYVRARKGMTFRLSPHVEARVLSAGPSAGLINVNDMGVVLLVSCGRFSALLTGDIEEAAEMALFDTAEPVNLLKVPHHGSETSLFMPYLRRLRPQVGILTVGRDNPFGHPSSRALSIYNGLGTTILRTDREGSILIRTDGLGIRIEPIPAGDIFADIP